MEPKKKSNIDYILYFIALLGIIWIGVHGAISWGWTETAINSGTIESSSKMFSFFQNLSTRLTEKPFDFQFNEHSQGWILWSFFWWFVIVVGIENSKKNFIAGKEYGTSKWGTKSDIQDLFADNIKAKEIKDAKKIGFKFLRPFIKFKKYRKAFQYSKKYLKDTLKMKEWSYIKFFILVKKQDEEAMEVKALFLDVLSKEIKNSWKPNIIKERFDEKVKNAEKDIFNEDEKKKLLEEAKRIYDKELNEFYSPKLRIEKIKNKYKDADMPLTNTEHISIYNYVLNNNVLIMGGSGAGKTRGFVMPNILQAHSSYIVTDPKGEILEKAGYFLKNIKGYKIRVLNLDDKANSDGYNPFVYVHPEREGFEERILSLIEAIIINTDGGEKKGGSDPFWDKAERLFLQSVFFFTAVAFPEEERNMNTVLALIGMLKIAEEEDAMDSDLDYFADMFAENFGEDHIGVQQYREFREKASGKTAKSIVISAVARLAPFRAQAIKKMFSYDTMQLDRVGEEKTAIFVVVPPTDDTFNFIAGMLFSQLFQELQYCATQVHKHEGQRLPVPCRFILDEFANTCKIPNFVKILAYARSFGIGIVPILQSLEQIKNMYKDEWGVIIDNCNTLLYLGSITHMDTLEYMSKLLGKGTFDKKTTGRTRGKSGSSSQNFDKLGRELMDASEIRKLPKKNCLLVLGGRNPFYSEKYNYENHPNYRYTSDANSKYSFHFDPKQNLPHSEEEEKTIKPSSRTKIIFDRIEMDTSLEKMIKRIMSNLNAMEPVSNDELVDTGEVLDKYSEIIMEFMQEEDDDIKMVSVSQEVQDILDGNNVQKIKMDTSIEHAISFIKDASNYEPVTDEELVDTGERIEYDDEDMSFDIEDENMDIFHEDLDEIIANSKDFLEEMIVNK